MNVSKEGSLLKKDVLLHVVHPYTWKLVDDTFIVGLVDEHTARDEHIGILGRTVLDTGGRILRYEAEHPQSLRGMIQHVSFESDPSFSFLLDERVQSVVTTLKGCPLPDEKPSKATEEQWKQYTETYATVSTLAKAVGTPDVSIFIGGALEACLANTISFHNHYYRRTGEEMLYVPELCAVFNEEQARDVKNLIGGLGAKAITYEDTMKLLENNNH